MSNINPTSSSIFTGYQRRPEAMNHARKAVLNHNDSARIAELENSKKDAKVQINEGVKEFARIKKAVDAAPAIDNSAKIEALKAQIANGTYKVDADALADKILASGDI